MRARGPSGRGARAHLYSQSVSPLAAPALPSTVELAGRRVEVTEVFWTYWYLAVERQAMFFRRLDGDPAPWTEDEVLRQYRFTNAYRASDRVSQYLLQHVIYDDDHDAQDVVLRVLLFKIFNRIDTWESITGAMGEVTAEGFDPDAVGAVLSERFDDGHKLYSAAYIMPSPPFGHERKHLNHLQLLDHLVREGSLSAMADAASLEDLYQLLRAVPSFGPFLAFQYAIDLNYSRSFHFSEMDYVVAGPGAVRGIEKCFVHTGGLESEDVIRAMAAGAEVFLEMAELDLADLWGRPLQLIDCQNLFCEVDKYARVVHPSIGERGPTRIKQNYRPNPEPLQIGYPPKWHLPVSVGPSTSEKPTSR